MNSRGQDYFILFVDDEEKTCKYFSKLFCDEFNVLTALNVEQAIQIIEQKANRIAVVIADQRMPVKRGSELLEYLYQQYPQIIRLSTTAFSSLDETVETINRGKLFHYIAKPWDIDQLRQTLKDALFTFLRQHKTRQAMMGLAGNIAHEIYTPLLSLKMGQARMKKSLDTLEDAQAGEILAKTLERSERTLDYINNVVGTLLASLHENPDRLESYQTHSMAGCIERALDLYPLSQAQRAKIAFNAAEDFLFSGSDILMTCVFFNLLKNALYAIAKAEKGEITIRLEPDSHENAVYFQDTGSGIEKEHLPFIFDDFFSSKTSQSSAGLGLAFCRKVLEGLKGSIACDSQFGEYTRFTLKLPTALRQADQANRAKELQGSITSIQKERKDMSM